MPEFTFYIANWRGNSNIFGVRTANNTFVLLRMRPKSRLYALAKFPRGWNAAPKKPKKSAKSNKAKARSNRKPLEPVFSLFYIQRQPIADGVVHVCTSAPTLQRSAFAKAVENCVLVPLIDRLLKERGAPSLKQPNVRV
jgi:hypothetical protein